MQSLRWACPVRERLPFARGKLFVGSHVGGLPYDRPDGSPAANEPAWTAYATLSCEPNARESSCSPIQYGRKTQACTVNRFQNQPRNTTMRMRAHGNSGR